MHVKNPPQSRVKISLSTTTSALFAVALVAMLLAGCSRFKHAVAPEYVYVSARQVYLHDRVAAVSNRVGLVTNGEALEVVEHGKRFTKVRTPKGEVGWLEDHAIIDDKLYAQFDELNKKHAQSPVEANGQLRDDLYLHLQPGRDTAHFLLVAGNTKVQMLQRGTIPKAAAPGALPQVKAPAPVATATGKSAPAQAASPNGAPSAADEPPQMEDWWLVRDSAGHTGWLLANRLDVDVPDEVGQYSEGQRMVAAYPIAKVFDDGSGSERKNRLREERSSRDAKAGKQGSSPNTKEPEQPVETSAPAEHTEYITVLSPPRGGLPYDFDQIRLFTWSLNHHRYETAYRLHGFQGYLPVKIAQETVNGQSMPTFSFDIATGPNVAGPKLAIDPESGVTHPVSARTLSFRLEGNLVRRTGPDMAPIILTRDHEEAGKAEGKTAKKKSR
jgi:SH3-like domain-containing protein